jgi:hypothetical protein
VRFSVVRESFLTVGECLIKRERRIISVRSKTAFRVWDGDEMKVDKGGVWADI